MQLQVISTKALELPKLFRKNPLNSTQNKKLFFLPSFFNAYTNANKN